MTYKDWTRNTLEMSLQSKKDRLRAGGKWLPLPVIISFYFVTILGVQLLTDLNPRLGARVKPIRYYSEEKVNPVTWLGIYSDSQSIHLITSERKKFSIPRESYDLKGLKDFIDHLKSIQEHHLLAMGRSLDSVDNRSRIAISVDRDLRFGEIKPLLYALAEANIGNFEFETQLIK